MRLGQNITPSFSTAIESGDLYEAYIFSLIIRAALNEGSVPEQGGALNFRDPDDNDTTTLLFRRSPGQIYAATQPYTHAVIEFAGKPPLEVHVGIKAMGRLKVARECDVAVLYREKAIACRAQNRIPKASDILLAIECKHIEELDLDIGSEFLGLTSDLRVKEAWFFVSSGASDGVARMLANARKE
ncbi:MULTISPECIES: hypothetical protein [Leptolyngbya]|uniref:hypothetical protein n=1 Tax=Leptolyngbya TaxID=47251 RepID=UPI0016826BA1|nr:hypothetical protein [Leptolyngbya sp. FACHB-1624]MBD1856200.1 hypothetical protein [Leptolyngbya sp. FACHB-1624]